MKIGPREQLILVIVGLLVVLVLAGVFLILPQFKKLQSMDAQIAAANQEVQQAQSLLSQRQSSKNKAADTDAQWLKLATMVPENPELPALIIDIQDAAFASGVQLQSLAPGDPKPPANESSFLAIPMEIKIYGTWADTIDFEKRILKLNRGMRIVEAGTSILSEGNSSNPALPKYSEQTVLQLEAYMIPASASASSTPAAPATQ